MKCFFINKLIDQLGIKNEIWTERKGKKIFVIYNDINFQNTGIDLNLNLSKKKLKKKDKNIFHYLKFNI